MNASFERPYRPVDLNISMTKAFPLMSMAEKLMREATFTTSGRASLTLARGDEMTVVLITLKAGAALKEHPAPATATVITLDGSIIFSTKATEISLEQGEAVTFTADVLHAVEAKEDSALLVIIGGAAHE